ncbi:conserved hypothetical protein [Candidatus Protochlamydia naegleriophila]|uniref:F-box domain-containing protein n=1 Tax=Candidatus Protochlamydia naegleriophila TaxID=389348 RepID=A0A0U5JDA8_9BACT|nr:F-box-like domain-containing protein [Candidatus Protochlamydia naegleriophila]CUI17502.1 conserved hypothetical protein [Candidatus Protochlamydia naegleriophila]
MTITHKYIHLSYYRIPTSANVEEKQPAICELSDDLLLQIFNYLGSLQDVATLNVTCKYWHWIALHHRDDLPLFATFQLFKPLLKKIEMLKLMPIQPFAERFTIIIKKNTSEIGEKTLTAHKVTRFEDSPAFEDFINDGQLICTFSEIKNASQVTQESAAIELAYIDDLILSDYEQDAITRISKKVGKGTEVKSGQEQRERVKNKRAFNCQVL